MAVQELVVSMLVRKLAKGLSGFYKKMFNGSASHKFRAISKLI